MYARSGELAARLLEDVLPDVAALPAEALPLAMLRPSDVPRLARYASGASCAHPALTEASIPEAHCSDDLGRALHPDAGAGIWADREPGAQCGPDPPVQPVAADEAVPEAVQCIPDAAQFAARSFVALADLDAAQSAVPVRERRGAREWRQVALAQPPLGRA